MSEQSRWSWKVWHKSNTMRALLVALVAWGLDKAGFPDEISQGIAQQVIELLLAGVEGGALLWAMYARTQQPTPPLALTKAAADQKNAAEQPTPPLTPTKPAAAAEHGAQS